LAILNFVGLKKKQSKKKHSIISKIETTDRKFFPTVKRSIKFIYYCIILAADGTRKLSYQQSHFIYQNDL